MAMQRRGIDVSRERGKNITPSLHSQANSNHRYQLLEPLHGTVFSTIPLPHIIPMGAGVAASSCSLGSVAWPPPWVGVIVAFSELTFDFLLPVKHYSTGCNSCHTGPLEDVDSAISVFSLSLCSYAMRLLGLAGPVERAGFSKNILYSQSRGGSKGRLVGSDSSQEAKRFQQTTKKLEPSTSVMYKDAYHNRTFRCCCHGTLGQDYPRPPFLSPSIYTSTKLCFWPFGPFLSSRRRSFLVLSAP